MATSAHRSARAPAPVEAQGVALDDRDPGVGHDLAQDRDQVTVDLHRRHRRPGLGQRQGQGPEAGADLDHVVAGADAGQAGDAAHGVGVGHEVLPQRPAGVQAVCLEQPADVPRREGHDRALVT